MADTINPVRQTALELANAFQGTPEDNVARAEAYLAFLTGGATKSTPRAKPQSSEPPAGTPLTPEERAANGLDDEPNPTAGPEVTAEPDPSASTAPQSDASAVSGSPSAQPTEAVQPAATSQSAPDLTKVQAAVLAYNRAHGRDKTIAVLTAHGGSRVPEIPVENHRALFDELNAGLAADAKIAE